VTLKSNQLLLVLRQTVADPQHCKGKVINRVVGCPRLMFRVGVVVKNTHYLRIFSSDFYISHCRSVWSAAGGGVGLSISGHLRPCSCGVFCVFAYFRLIFVRAIAVDCRKYTNSAKSRTTCVRDVRTRSRRPLTIIVIEFGGRYTTKSAS